MAKYIYHPSTNEESKTVRDNLIEFNRRQAPQLAEGHEDISFHVCDEADNVVAGVLAERQGNWIEISILWVSDLHRKNGLGSQIINRIEQIAIDKECLYIKLDTFGFQALDFYKKLGYEIFGQLDNPIRELTHYYMIKYFDSGKK